MKHIKPFLVCVKCFTLLLVLLVTSCSPNFHKPHYKKRFSVGHTWKRRHITLFETDLYRDPRIKKEKRREMIQPKTILLDDY